MSLPFFDCLGPWEGWDNDLWIISNALVKTNIFPIDLLCIVLSQALYMWLNHVWRPAPEIFTGNRLVLIYCCDSIKTTLPRTFRIVVCKTRNVTCGLSSNASSKCSLSISGMVSKSCLQANISQLNWINVHKFFPKQREVVAGAEAIGHRPAADAKSRTAVFLAHSRENFIGQKYFKAHISL